MSRATTARLVPGCCSSQPTWLRKRQRPRPPIANRSARFGPAPVQRSVRLTRLCTVACATYDATVIRSGYESLNSRAATCCGIRDAEQHRAGHRLANEGKYDRVEVQPLDKPEAGLEVDAAYHEAGLHPRNCKLALQRLVVSEECCPPCVALVDMP